MRQTGEWIHGKYQVLRLLGAGGMGVVYATKRRNESLAAVKVLHPRFAKDKSIRARFLEEGYLANRVGHPAVVTILEDDIDEEGNFYIVMELLDGVDLGKFVGPPRLGMSTAQVLNIVDQLLAALAQAHQKGIVHRDIKPSNVMILRDGRIKLLDFGIAKALHADGTVSALDDDEEEEVLGTDRYMSPEQGNGFFEDIDARSDLWSVGALMMALLAEPDDSSVPLWDQSYEDRAWSFARLGQDVPPHVVQIISLALQPQKSKRWVSAAAMREAVHAAHVNLYGPISSEPLALLAKAQLPSPSEAPAAAPLEEAPKTRVVVEPPVIDPTIPSRPSHPPPSPRVHRRADAAPVVQESPVPPVVAARGPAWGSLRNLGWGLLLFALGALVTLLATRGMFHSSDAQTPEQEQARPPLTHTETPQVSPTSSDQTPAPQSNAAPGTTPKTSADPAAHAPDNDPVAQPKASGRASSGRTTAPKPSAGSKASPTPSAPAQTSGPPKNSGDPASDARARCNGLDGIFNVETCQ